MSWYYMRHTVGDTFGVPFEAYCARNASPILDNTGDIFYSRLRHTVGDMSEVLSETRGWRYTLEVHLKDTPPPTSLSSPVLQGFPLPPYTHLSRLLPPTSQPLIALQGLLQLSISLPEFPNTTPRPTYSQFLFQTLQMVPW